MTNGDNYHSVFFSPLRQKIKKYKKYKNNFYTEQSIKKHIWAAGDCFDAVYSFVLEEQKMHIMLDLAAITAQQSRVKHAET